LFFNGCSKSSILEGHHLGRVLAYNPSFREKNHTSTLIYHVFGELNSPKSRSAITPVDWNMQPSKHPAKEWNLGDGRFTHEGIREAHKAHHSDIEITEMIGHTYVGLTFIHMFSSFNFHFKTKAPKKDVSPGTVPFVAVAGPTGYVHHQQIGRKEEEKNNVENYKTVQGEQSLF
jgi:hypothetical protein